ncbi:MAG: hypothetical protein C0501_05980 [Isosphaera sp.]|nr:hypothetical protein [Isosphaera sp.]
MNFRLPAVLFGTILVLGAVLLIFSLTGEEKETATGVAEELAGTKPDQVDAVEVARPGGGGFKFVRDGKAPWRVAEPYAAKADQAAVGQLVAALLQAKPVAHPELKNNPAAHGLQPAGLSVTLRAGGKASTVNLGDLTFGEGGGVVFVTTSARPTRPMAIPRSAVEPLLRGSAAVGPAADQAKGVADFRAKTVFPADARGAGDDVAAVTVAAKGKTLSLARSAAGGWTFVSPPDWGAADPSGDAAAPPGTFTGVSRLLGTLTSLQAQTAADFVDNPSPQDLEKYGLNDGNPNRVKVELRTKEGETTTAYVGNKADAAPAAGALPGSGKWWVKVDGQPGVVRATGGDLAGLAAVVENPDPLRDRNLLAFDKSRVDGLDLGPVKLRRVGFGAAAQWKLYGNPAAGDPQPAAPAEVNRVLDLLTERRTVTGFPKGDPGAFGPADPVVKVWADGFEPAAPPKKDEKVDPKAEPKEKAGPVTLTFGRKQGDAVNVRRVSADGKTTDYLLVSDRVKVEGTKDPVDPMAVVTKTRLDFLDRDLKRFTASTVGKLVVQGAATYDLDRAEGADPSAGGPGWKFAQDAKGPLGQAYKAGDLADTPTVQGLLDPLATTFMVTRFVDEAPTPQKLDEYGLGSNVRMRVTVGLRETGPDDKERVFEFGADAPGGAEVYARQKGRQAVFTLPKSLPDQFTGADLRNKSIFRIDPAAVTSVTVTGWGAPFGGTPGKLVLRKNKSGVWEAAESVTKGYAVDPVKVAGFLSLVSNTRVRAFTADRQEPGDRHKFNDGKVLFDVLIGTAADTHALYFRLGGPADPGGSEAYALTNRLPADRNICVVDAALFRAYRDAPGAFAK